MNVAIIEGRICDDLKLMQTKSGKEWCRLTIAVDRPQSKDANGNKRDKVTDFIRVVLWGNQAKYICTYAEKGKRINVVGTIETGKYNNDQTNQTVYYTEIRAEKVEIIDWKDTNASREAGNRNQPAYSSAPVAPTQAPGPSDFGPGPDPAGAFYDDYEDVNSYF